MEPEKRKRADFRGEYSILGAMIKSASKERRQLYKEMLHKFFESEVSIPNLSEQIGGYKLFLCFLPFCFCACLLSGI